MVGSASVWALAALAVFFQLCNWRSFWNTSSWRPFCRRVNGKRHGGFFWFFFTCFFTNKMEIYQQKKVDMVSPKISKNTKIRISRKTTWDKEPMKAGFLPSSLALESLELGVRGAPTIPKIPMFIGGIVCLPFPVTRVVNMTLFQLQIYTQMVLEATTFIRF